MPLNDALDAILSVNGYRWVIQNNIIMVSSLSGGVDLSPRVQGREVCVFNLDFVSATDIDQTVQGLLSPVGTSFVTEVSSEDKLRTREELVVQDIPEYLDRVRAYIAQADQPPQQVLTEAHILQAMARMANSDVTFSSNGFDH